MRVLQVSSAMRYGGCEKHIRELSAGLSANGVEVWGVVRPGCEWKKMLTDPASGPPFEVGLTGPRDLRSAIRLAGFARRIGADIIHAHLPCDYVPASLAARMTAARLILTHHGTSPISSGTSILTRNAVRMIAVSYGAESRLSESFGRERLARIPCGIPDRDRTSSKGFRSEYGVGREKRIVAAIGDLSPKRRQDDLILAAAEVAGKVPDAFFVFVGKEDRRGGAFKRKLRRLVKVSGLENSVLFLDRLEDIRPLLADSEVFVACSGSDDPDLAALEAIAAGVPVVSTSTDGIEGTVEGRAGELLSAAADPVGIAQDICRILLDQELAVELAGSARQRAEKQFSLERMVESTLETYKEAIEEE